VLLLALGVGWFAGYATWVASGRRGLFEDVLPPDSDAPAAAPAPYGPPYREVPGAPTLDAPRRAPAEQPVPGASAGDARSGVARDEAWTRADLDRSLGRPATADEWDEFRRWRPGSEGRTPAAFASMVRQREAAERVRLEVRRRAAEDFQRSGVAAVLERQAKGGGRDLFDLLAGAEFEASFRPASVGVVHPVPSGAAPPREIGDGDVLRFGPGSHRFGAQRWSRTRFPRDLVIEGAGADHTLVTFDEFQTASGPILNLTFRDLTVDCGNDHLFDVRADGPVVLRFERCRVVRFDMGAGGSVCLATTGLAAWMTDTTFETGYGRSPPYGSVLRASGPALVRMERCTVRGARLGEVGNGSHVLLVGGALLDQDPPPDLSGTSGWLRARDTTVSAAPTDPASSEARRRTRPLSDLNPAWKDVR
jgi:hypothetical protein